MNETLNVNKSKNYNQIVSLTVLFPISVAVNLLLGIFIRDNELIPLWLDGTGSYFAAAIGGPVYGVIVHVVYLIIHTTSEMVNMSYLLTLFPAIGGLVSFSLMAKCGYFRSKRDLLRIILVITLVYTIASTPVLIATTGGVPTSNILAENLFYWLDDVILPTPIATFITVLITKAIDNIISLSVSYFLIHKGWKFWDAHFDVKCMEEIKIAVVKKKNNEV